VDGTTQLVFLLVVGARFLVPLAIPRWPLPAILASLVLDAADQTIFQALGQDPPGYQSYDKAMDVYYLAIAYLATLRNWSSVPAFAVGRFLYFFRLVGVVAFELSHARPLLLIFPNTFEYFFIAYEAVRSRWAPTRFGARWWLGAAALIWVVVKLPQEYWIHVARLDVTDQLAAHTWAGPVLVLVGVGTALVVRRRVGPRLPPPAWPWKLAADPLPEAVDTAREQQEWHLVHGRVWSWPTLEKVVLVGLLAVVYGQTLPGVSATPVELFTGIGVVVALNASLSLVLARRRWTTESSLLAFAGRMAVNVGVVAAAEALLGLGSEDVDTVSSLFFLGLISLVTTLHDRWLPVHRLRVRDAETAGAPVPLAGR
jgi:hypothetical protein